MMSVEYVTPANDGRGRLYARQIGAQSLPRQLRLLIDGDTHKEVDMSGDELTRSPGGGCGPLFFFNRWLHRISRILAVLDYEVVKQATPEVLRPKRKSSAHSL